MPVTRFAAAIGLNGTVAANPSTNGGRLSIKPVAPEVIVISDDEDDVGVEPLLRYGTKKRKISDVVSSGSKKRTSRSQSSDIEEVQPPEGSVKPKSWKFSDKAAAKVPNASVQALRDRIIMLESAEQNARTEVHTILRRMEDLHNKETRASARAEKAEKELKKLAICTDIDGLQDAVSCGICEGSMWQAWTLGECGHVFCQGCLRSWFQSILAKHLERYPQYNVKKTPEFVLPEHIARYPAVIHPLFVAGNNLPRPNYSCPLCRERILRRPCESFVVKKIVHFMAEKMGEIHPHVLLQNTDVRNRILTGPDKAPAAGLWHEFFG